MRLKTVLCPVDFTSLSDREVHLGVAICQRGSHRFLNQHVDTRLRSQNSRLCVQGMRCADDNGLGTGAFQQFANVIVRLTSVMSRECLGALTVAIANSHEL